MKTRSAILPIAAIVAALLAGLCCGGPQRAAGQSTGPRDAPAPDQELPPMLSRGQPAILKVAPSADKVPRYGKLELTVDLAASYDNPFDPDQISLTAEFTTPSRKKIIVPGFFYQAYRNRHEGDDSRSPLLDAAGPPCWKVRFTPTEVGAHLCTVKLRNNFGNTTGERAAPPVRFVALASRAPGFIRVSPADRRHFRFDDGTPFFPVGQNLQNDWHVYSHSRSLAAGGANCARVWMFCHWTWLEWTFKGGIQWAGPGHWMRAYAGAGRYNQRVAWIADHHLEAWARDGLRLMLCLGNGTGGGELSPGDRYDGWGGHPYNLSNGGFLDEPGEFWTDQRSRKLYQQRLRYIVARLGYSPNIWAWELWNELGEATPAMAAWHKEMAACLRRLDPNRHLVSTSTWQWVPEKFAAVWDLAEMDFTQSHIYEPLPAMTARVGAHLARWDKPHVIGEGGGPSPQRDGDAPGKDCVVDPEGIEFHNSLWAPLGLGAAGATLPWWWRGRIEPRNLFFHYQSVAAFARDVPWTNSRFRPVRVTALSLTGAGAGRKLSPVLIVPLGSGWGDKPAQSRFTVRADGVMPDAGRFPVQLFGSGRKEWRNPPAIEVDFPEPGRFILHVGETSHGILEIRVDAKLVLREESLNTPRRAVEKDFSVAVPAGRHEIGLDNAGGDWIRIGHFMLASYRDGLRHPDLDIYGLQTDDMAVLWIHNRLSQWSFKAAGFDPEPVGPALATLSGLKNGRYRVEWWDTYRGAAVRTERLEANNHALTVPIPALERDIACKIRREGR